ncbi:Uncharacterized protein APZ42_018273 [Daphnia magna]|uniref:Uncharacterized protein n=1 Tax=Daphnia magna TaxID=35525 RepID=A0A164Z834_9CRUS|nr:Uncharacterized protein APZ42_018273 [Daphnia magna]
MNSGLNVTKAAPNKWRHIKSLLLFSSIKLRASLKEKKKKKEKK